MIYLGGKDRIGNLIAKAILAATTKREEYIEPFFGGGNSFPHFAAHFKTCKVGDVHEDLIAMWVAIKDGWYPPEDVSEAEYARVKRLPSPSALKGFVGFAASFGGKWWGGYARGEARNYAATQTRGVDRIGSALRLSDAMILNVGYEGWNPTEKSVVYADPPYFGTTSYSRYFSHERFWKKMDEWVEQGVSVFVSEYSAPKHWKVLCEIEHSCTLHTVKTDSVTANRRVERVFAR